MGDRYPDLREPATLTMLYEHLQAGATKKSKAAKAPVPAPAIPQGRAWDVLREHQDDAQLTPAILEQIGAALTTPASAEEAEQLAGVVMDWLDSVESREEAEVTT
jgi:hypothetical protein